MSRTRVVHVVVAGEIGGAERMLVDLASRPALSGAEHAVALMTPSDALAAHFREAGLAFHDRGRVHENPAAYLWRSLGPSETQWVARVLAEERATVAHLHTFGSHVVGARAALVQGIPIVRTEHSTRAYVDPSCWPFSRWSLRRAERVVAISAYVRDAALSRAPWIAPRLTVIHNGVDTARFAPVPLPHAARPRFALVGRFEPRKGIDLALDALALVPDATLDIVGDGEERPLLEQRARALVGRVAFHGRLEDVRPVLAACDAVLCSSREEGLGIALLEGMAMGRPVIAVPVGGIPEIVDHGVTGLLAAEPTASALAERMREASSDPARLARMGRAARLRVEARFSIGAMCAAYGDVYARVASARRSA